MYQNQYPGQPQYLQQQARQPQQQQQQPQQAALQQQNQAWARYQLGQVAQFYPGLMLESSTPEVDRYRVPLLIQVSKTPLHIRIDCPRNFPTQRPNFCVQARVVHADLHPRTKVVNNQMLDNWDLFKNSSNLLSVLRDVHARFDANPPIPEKLIQQQQQEAASKKEKDQKISIREEPQQPAPQDAQNVQIQENVAKVVKEEPKKSLVITDKLTKIQQEMKNLDKQLEDQLPVLHKTEIEYMRDNQEYLQDFALTQPLAVQFESLYDQSKDMGKEVADENQAYHGELEEQKAENEELQSQYEEKAAELRSLLAQLEGKKAAYSKQALVKMVQMEAVKVNKESTQIQKQVKKGELPLDQYVEQFKKKRQEYHGMAIVASAIGEMKF